MTDRFPMQNGPPIDWETARAIYVMYADLFGNDQSLETIARRGGFGWAEVEFIWNKYDKKQRRQRYPGFLNPQPSSDAVPTTSTQIIPAQGPP